MKRPPFDPSRVVVPPEDRVRETSAPVLTVTQVTHAVKRAIEEHLPRTIRVIGEISNFKRHTSGHLYFTLKDERSELSCVMWRSDAKSLKFDVTDGLEVIATGGIDVFERAGRTVEQLVDS